VYTSKSNKGIVKMKTVGYFLSSVRQLTGLLVALGVEFVLGIVLTTVLHYDPGKHDSLQMLVLFLHIFVGVGILAGGIVRLVAAVKQQSLRIAAATGLLNTCGAFGSGDVATKAGSGLAVFVMAACFFVAFVAYGYSLLAVRQTLPKQA
jgi:predicted permease